MSERPKSGARRLVLAALASFALAVGAHPARAADEGVLVFAAASLKNALDDVIAAYAKHDKTKVTASYAASSASRSATRLTP